MYSSSVAILDLERWREHASPNGGECERGACRTIRLSYGTSGLQGRMPELYGRVGFGQMLTEKYEPSLLHTSKGSEDMRPGCRAHIVRVGKHGYLDITVLMAESSRIGVAHSR